MLRDGLCSPRSFLFQAGQEPKTTGERKRKPRSENWVFPITSDPITANISDPHFAFFLILAWVLQTFFPQPAMRDQQSGQAAYQVRIRQSARQGAGQGSFSQPMGWLWMQNFTDIREDPDFSSISANENGLRVPYKYSFPVLVAVLVNR
jgi:hypothetical protein